MFSNDRRDDHGLSQPNAGQRRQAGRSQGWHARAEVGDPFHRAGERKVI